MKGRTNAGGGSAFAVIDVTCPEDAVCTCGNGIRTLKARGGSGRWMFIIPRAGEWTVNVSLGETTKSQTVNAAESKIYNLLFTFTLILFDNGTYAPESGGFTNIVNGNKLSLTAGEYQTVNGNSNNPIDLTSYKTIHFEGIYFNGYPENCCGYVGVGSAKGGENAAGFSAVSSVSGPEVSNVTRSVDISELTGSYYIKYRVDVWSGSARGLMTLTKIWLE